MVLLKDSSILGYGEEISKPLDANHHDVCKFTDPQDPNYKSVREALGTIITKLQGDCKKAGLPAVVKLC